MLHLLRYSRVQLATTLEQINATGYGLTQGVHTRIDETVAQVVAASSAGNVYVNRNIVGAVVGVQPFGGEGLSGTGPKAGGPLYLLRLLAERPGQAARLAVAHNANAAQLAVQLAADSAADSALRSAAPNSNAARPTSPGTSDVAQPALRGLPASAGEHDATESSAALRAWAQARSLRLLAAQCDQAVADSPVGNWQALNGPTGEANLYAVLPRAAVLCLADNDADRLAQLAAVLAVGSRAVWPASAQSLRDRLPAEVRDQVSLAQDWRQAAVHFDAVLQHGPAAALLATAAALAARPGPIIGLTAMSPGDARVPLERLVKERSLSVNTAAAGGNASLMMIG